MYAKLMVDNVYRMALRPLKLFHMRPMVFKVGLILIVLLNCNHAFGQFYDNNNYYLYIEVGQTVESSSKISYVHFNSNGNLYNGSLNKSEAQNKYSNGILDEYAINKSHSFKYCSSVSTDKYEVYREPRTEYRQNFNQQWYPGYVPSWGENVKIGGYWYRAFSKDRNEMIIWHTTRSSEEAQSKKYYKRIKPSDLKPKKVNYDFL